MNEAIQVIKMNPVQNVDQLIQAIVTKAVKEGITTDSAALTDGLKTREQLGLTRIAEQVVLPHVLGTYILKNTVLIYHLTQPIDWVDGNLVSTVIVLLMAGPDSLIDTFLGVIADEQKLAYISNPQTGVHDVQKLMLEERN